MVAYDLHHEACGDSEADKIGVCLPHLASWKYFTSSHPRLDWHSPRCSAYRMFESVDYKLYGEDTGASLEPCSSTRSKCCSIHYRANTRGRASWNPDTAQLERVCALERLLEMRNLDAGIIYVPFIE